MKIGLRLWVAFFCTSLQVLGSNYSHLRGLKKAETIGFELVHNLIIFKILIADSDSLNFIFDSGVKTPILFGLPYGCELKFDYSRKYLIEGLGLNQPIEAYYSPKNQFIIADFISLDQDVLVLPTDVLELSNFLGVEIHGLMGFDLLENFVVSADYLKKSLTLSPHQLKKRIPSSYQAFDLQIQNRRAYLAVPLQDSARNTYKVKLLVDTGASHSISVFYHTLPDFSLPALRFESFLGRGLQGEIYGFIGRLTRLELGKFAFANPVAFFPHEKYVAHLCSEGRNGSIGADFFVRFHWVVDYKAQKLYLKANKMIYRDFGYNITGIEVIFFDSGLPGYQVVNLRANSAAVQAGLQINDRILSLNGMNVAQIERNEMILNLQGHLSKKIRITLLRNNKLIKIKFPVIDPTLPQTQP
jgi:hypothetical protein